MCASSFHVAGVVWWGRGEKNEKIHHMRKCSDENWRRSTSQREKSLRLHISPVHFANVLPPRDRVTSLITSFICVSFTLAMMINSESLVSFIILKVDESSRALFFSRRKLCFQHRSTLPCPPDFFRVLKATFTLNCWLTIFLGIFLLVMDFNLWFIFLEQSDRASLNCLDTSVDM